MKVKICGITDVNTAIEAVKYGADALGFVFTKSKRQISIDAAKEIIANLPKEVLKVGVFVNETKEEIESTASFVGLTHIQLHGDEDVAFCQMLSLPVIKALSICNEGILNEIKELPGQFLLLDGPAGKYRGGNGVAFEWNTIDKEILGERNIILAGGLHEGNVEEAIQTINPYMVDVSSGVETNGKKDIMKIKLFIEKAKGCRTGRK